jgi:hypothetical protein
MNDFVGLSYLRKRDFPKLFEVGTAELISGAKNSAKFDPLVSSFDFLDLICFLIIEMIILYNVNHRKNDTVKFNSTDA